MKTPATWDFNEPQPKAWAQATLNSIPEFPKLSWSFNQKHLGRWAVSTFQVQGTSGFVEHRIQGLEFGAGRALPASTGPVLDKASLLIFAVHKIHTTWLYFDEPRKMYSSVENIFKIPLMGNRLFFRSSSTSNPKMLKSDKVWKEQEKAHPPSSTCYLLTPPALSFFSGTLYPLP